MIATITPHTVRTNPYFIHPVNHLRTPRRFRNILLHRTGQDHLDFKAPHVAYRLGPRLVRLIQSQEPLRQSLLRPIVVAHYIIQDLSAVRATRLDLMRRKHVLLPLGVGAPLVIRVVQLDNVPRPELPRGAAAVVQSNVSCPFLEAFMMIADTFELLTLGLVGGGGETFVDGGGVGVFDLLDLFGFVEHVLEDGVGSCECVRG